VAYYKVPKHLLKDERLKANHILLYAIILSLSELKGYCFASNDFLSQELKCDKRQIQRELAYLKKSGYILVKDAHTARKIYPLELLLKDKPNPDDYYDWMDED